MCLVQPLVAAHQAVVDGDVVHGGVQAHVDAVAERQRRADGLLARQVMVKITKRRREGNGFPNK